MAGQTLRNARRFVAAVESQRLRMPLEMMNIRPE
jgi:hypothetical protein